MLNSIFTYCRRLVFHAPALSLALVLTPLAAPSSAGFLVASNVAPAPSGAKALCRTYGWACAAAGGRQLSAQAEFGAVRSVNRKINARFSMISDMQQYRRSEHWALPTGRGGDCEDFALAKKRALIAAGVAPRRLLLATALDRQRRAHAVLIYRAPQGDLVLDNQTDRIRSWQDTGYVFLRMQNPRNPARWVSGFRGS